MNIILYDNGSDSIMKIQKKADKKKLFLQLELFLVKWSSRLNLILRKSWYTIEKEWQQERLLGQRKTPRAHNFSYVTSRLIYYRSYSTQNLSHLDVDHTRSLKVKCDSIIGLPINGFLLVLHSNIIVCPNSAYLFDTGLQSQ